MLHRGTQQARGIFETAHLDIEQTQSRRRLGRSGIKLKSRTKSLFG